MLYRNIGGGNRLNFTCIGPAVNLAARPERIAARLGRTVVALEGFAGMCRGGWSDLGEFPIAGFSRPPASTALSTNHRTRSTTRRFFA
jgi:adenylate cyclase